MLAVIRDSPEDLSVKYAQVKIVGRMDAPWAMPFERHNIYRLEGRRASAPVRWADEKFFY